MCLPESPKGLNLAQKAAVEGTEEASIIRMLPGEEG